MRSTSSSFAIKGGENARTSEPGIGRQINPIPSACRETLVAIRSAGAASVRSVAPLWLRAAAVCGLAVSLLTIFFTVYPIIDVPNPLLFGAKIAVTTIIANALGVAIFITAGRRQKR